MARLSPNRNGGRHCCQPPLRRAKDLPVFVTWKIKPCGLPTRSRSWLTSSGVAFHRTAPSCEEPRPLLDCASRRFACLSLSGLSTDLSLSTQVLEPKPLNPRLATCVPEPKSSGQSRPMFRGPSWDNLSRVPLRSPSLRRASGAASRDRKIISSGASSRLAPKRTRKLFSLPAGGDRLFCPFLALVAVAGLPGRLGLPPRSLEDHAPSFRVAEAKFSVTSLWIMGISGATVGTLSKRALRQSESPAAASRDTARTREFRSSD